MSIYQPAEDSFLMKKLLKHHIKKTDSVLEIGTGSGILACEAAKYAKKVLAIDINPEAVKKLKEWIKEKKIKNLTTKKSDLFKNITGKFDVIIFNPPYLPLDKNEPKESRLATTGGKLGYEVIERFLNEASNYLDGKLLLLFSSLSVPKKIHEILEKNVFDYKKIASQKMFFEELFIYEITKTVFHKELTNLKIKDIKKFTHGHRGQIFTGTYRKTKVAIKKQLENIDARNTVNREIKFLKRLNKINIGPKLLKHGEDFFVYEFIEGEFIEKWIINNTKPKIKSMLKNIFNQCFTMDKLKINKEEMHNPFKHVVIKKEPVMLDFERTNFTTKPKNVTQFCQYVNKLKPILEKKGFSIDIFKLRQLSKEYKNNISKKSFNKIINSI